MQLEEMEALVKGELPPGKYDAAAAADEVRRLCAAAIASWEGYHRTSLEKVEALVKTFLPQDWRGAIVNTFRQRSEAASAQALADLAAAGGTVQQKYDLLWEQQMGRRQTLVNLGNASGVFRAVLTYLGGVPQALLDFVKTVNDDQGPMEQFRATYGPYQYFLTLFVNKIRVHLAYVYAAGMLLQSNKPIAPEHHEALRNLIDAGVPLVLKHLAAYQEAAKAFCELLGEIMLNSPYFVRKEDIESSCATEGRPVDVVVTYNHEVAIAGMAGDTVTWEFTTKGMDIKFGAAFEPANAEKGKGKKETIAPMTLVNSHIAPVSGEFVLPADGTVRLTWDNTYSWLYNKELHLTTKLVPNKERLEREIEGLLDQAASGPAPTISPIS